MRIFLILIVLCCSAPAVAEGDLPEYNIEDYCLEIATRTSTLTASMLRSCVNAEQKAYENVRRMWTELPESGKVGCISLVERIKRSYVILNACVLREAKSKVAG